jgi:hypothetical protein
LLAQDDCRSDGMRADNARAETWPAKSLNLRGRLIDVHAILVLTIHFGDGRQEVSHIRLEAARLVVRCRPGIDANGQSARTSWTSNV